MNNKRVAPKQVPLQAMNIESNILSNLPENIWLYQSAFVMVGINSVDFTQELLLGFCCSHSVNQIYILDMSETYCNVKMQKKPVQNKRNRSVGCSIFLSGVLRNDITIQTVGKSTSHRSLTSAHISVPAAICRQ